MLTDLHYGIRLLLRSPGFTGVAVVALAVGIGANLTIFGFASNLLVSPLRGVVEPGRVVRAFTNRFSGTAYADYETYRERNHTFAALAAFQGESISLRADTAPEQAFGLVVSGNYFATLGISAGSGRPIVAADDRPGAPEVVLISDRFWRVRFGANPRLVGQTLTLNGRPRVVIGVLPAGFTGTMAPLVPDLYIPITQSGGADAGSVHMIGRLQPGGSIGQAQADLTTLATQLAQARPPSGQRPMITVYRARALAPEIAVPAAVFAGVLLTVAGLVLLIACVNIANLLLARSAGRRREIGIRLALGASRGRLVRQMLTESVLLSAAGGAAAAVLAVAAARSIAAGARSLPAPVPIGLDFTVDWRVLATAAGLSMATTIAFGLVPALQSSKSDVLPALKDGVATAGAARSRLRGAFVTAQVAMSTLLLVIAGLLIRGVLSAQTLDRGLVTEGVLAASVDLRSSGYTPERGAAFYAALLERLGQAPGIRSATIVDIVPLTLSNRAGQMVKDDQDAPAGNDAPLVYSNAVSAGHFRTLGMPLLAGRDFETRDRAGAPLVAIVNDTLARRFWPGESPLGKHLRDRTGPQSFGPPLEVVGLARDSKYATVGEDPKAFLYRPLSQQYSPGGTILVKSASRPTDALAGLRASVAGLDPNLPVFNVMTLDAATSISLLPVKAAATVAGSLGLVALALGVIGLYGVMSFLVRQRTREIGIRMALGAPGDAVVRLITKQGMRWTTIGLALGLGASLGVARLMAGFLYGVRPADPAAFSIITALLIGTAYLACHIPARRASRIDPLDALRDE